MTSEEIHLNAALEKAGIEVTETDFGEFIIQLAGERPSHLVAPAVHHTRESIAGSCRNISESRCPMMRRAWRWRDGEPAGEVLPRRSGHYGRQLCRGGDGHHCVSDERGEWPADDDLAARPYCPDGHGEGHSAAGGSAGVSEIAGAGGHGAAAVGVHDDHHGAAPAGGIGRPGGISSRDPGQRPIEDSGQPFRESLQCIRCGACLNACPVYRRIGGHAYGGVYSGPIGSILTPLYDSVSDNPHLPHASSLCGACQAACPVKINIPHMLIGLRELQHHAKRNRWEELAYRCWKEILRRPWLYRLALQSARLLLRPFATGSWLQKLPGPARGWTAVRDFPAPAARSFRERWKELQ